MVLLRTLFYHCRLKSCWSQEDCGFQIADNYSQPFCENWGQSLFSLSFSLSNGAEENAAAYCWSTIITKRNIIRLPNSFFSGVFGLLLVLSLRFVYKNIYSMYTISFFFLLFRVRKRAAATQWWTRRNFVIIRVSRKWPRWRQQSQRERGREFSRKGLLWLAFTCLCALLHCLRCGPPVSRDTDVVQTTHAHYSAPFFLTICHFWKEEEKELPRVAISVVCARLLSAIFDSWVCRGTYYYYYTCVQVPSDGPWTSPVTPDTSADSAGERRSFNSPMEFSSGFPSCSVSPAKQSQFRRHDWN